jgi:predicted secreted protein
MATHLGKDGVIKVSGETIAEVRSWTLNTTVETVDVSHLGDDWKVHKATQKSWHGSLSCFWDESEGSGQTALALGETVTLQLYLENSAPPAFSGAALVTGVDVTGSHNGLVEASIAFQGSGALEGAQARGKITPSFIKEQSAAKIVTVRSEV